MKIKVCILTSVHSPFDVRIFHKEAKSLVKAGYAVTLIAQHNKEEFVDGIKIVNLQRPRNRIERMTKTAWSACRKAVQVDADIYHFHDPELIPVGMLLKMMGSKVIYDVHEEVPSQILHKHYMPIITRKLLSRFAVAMEWVGSKVFDVIIPATPKIAKHFPQNKTFTIQNFPIADELSIPMQTTYDSRPKAFGYMGSITTVRGVEEMLKAIELVGMTTDARLHLAGNFSPDKLCGEMQKRAAWAFVDYYGLISRKQISMFLDNIRAGLVLFHPLPNHVDAQPNKLFEYMSVGLPVIASDFPLWRRMIESVDCGLVVNPLNPKAIAAAMCWILDHPAEANEMGRRGRQAVAQIYNWDAEAAKLIDVYKKLLA